MRPLKVGDWVRHVDRPVIYRVEKVDDCNLWQARIDGGDAVRVIVRDAKPPKRVKASELWAWLHMVGGWIQPSVAPTDPKNKWACWWSSTEAVEGETPTRAIIAARRLYRP